MADDKTKAGAQGRSQVASTQDYALQQFAITHKISMQQVRELVERVGNSRAALEGAVRLMQN